VVKSGIRGEGTLDHGLFFFERHISR
jgi:hypothetical protein